MIEALREFTDRLLGRGTASITVPVMDGTLKPNRLLDNATVLAELPLIDDLASDGHTLWASACTTLYRWTDGQWQKVRAFDVPITALAAHTGGLLAVALNGKQVQVFKDGADTPVARLDTLAGQAMCGVNAVCFENAQHLLITDGSTRRVPAQWCHDLMERGHTGRLARWDWAQPQATLLAQGLHHAFGVLPTPGGVLVSESWRHRVQRLGAAGLQPLVADLPGYASRMAPASAGGFWLTCFVCRTQLVEFVLREKAYRERMMREIAPEHWIAPALSSGKSFLEPLQGASVKNMGVLKPWAPPRSYGLLLRVADDGRILQSLHSQVDGQHHGITAVVEHAGGLLVASKGSGRLLHITPEALS
jgi:hypothetical protein